ncbi:MAG: MBL fold metallo-hydrolase [Acidobacteria bacterium]|nr:MBL fold metallo-hydrolase [Acidobacteriota bacterium]
MMNRREALQAGAGALMGASAVLAGRTRAAAQDVQPTPPPATDSRYPMPPRWNRELRQLAPNVYAYMQGGGPGLSAAGVSNAGLIAGRDFLVAIDALQGPVPARNFIAAAKQATGKEIQRLILTHHHGDHVNGLQFFTQAEVLSHPYCRAEVAKMAPTVPKMWVPTPGVADVAEERRLPVPPVTFKDDMVYMIGGTEVQFRVVGPAHTWGDVVAYLPQHKIVFLGDVGFFWVAPYANNSYITKWIDVCNAILGWDVDVLVPGHGPIGGKKELAEMRDYFQVLGVEARKRYDAKMPAGAAAAEIRLGRFDNWIGPERLIMDVVRWYAEWNGSLTPDYNAAAVREATVEYNAVKARDKKTAELIPLSRMDDLAAEV